MHISDIQVVMNIASPCPEFKAPLCTCSHQVLLPDLLLSSPTSLPTLTSIHDAIFSCSRISFSLLILYFI